MKEELLVSYSNVKKQSCLQKLLKRKRNLSDMDDRMIVSNIPDPDIGNNKISTSKYNLISFPIFNLLEQFTKPSNIYFLIIGILQMIPAISVSEGKPTMFFPLTMVVVISMIKDFFEDWKRRKNDKVQNESEIQILNEIGWTKAKWEDVLVGNIIKVYKNQYFPCDALLLKHGSQAKMAYAQTKNLDGQTNLKLKKVPQCLSFLQKQKSEHGLQNLQAQVFYQKPNPFISSFNGNLKHMNKKYPLENTNIILRGCSLKINSYAIGLCLYNGHQSKIMQNSSHAVAKRSSLQKTLNTYFKFICIFQIIITLLCSLIYGGIVSNQYSSLGYIMQSPYFVMDVISDWGSWFISISNFIPISLLVTVQLVRYGQGWLINNQGLSGNKNQAKQTIEVQTSSVNEQLGQIQYILSDKTGTLTQNIMEFKCLLVDNKNYGFISQEEQKQRARTDSMLTMEDTFILDKELLKLQQTPNDKILRNQQSKLTLHLNAESNKQSIAIEMQQKIQQAEISQKGINKNNNKISQLLPKKRPQYVDFAHIQKQRLLYDLKLELQLNEKELIQQQNIQEQLQNVPQLELNNKQKIHSILLHLALCHNVITENDGYSSSSPDQLALVSFAKSMGYVFIQKDDDGYMVVDIDLSAKHQNKKEIQTTHKTLRSKLLHVLQFTSQRKRMSVILQSQSSNEVILLIKGADDTIISRSDLSETSEEYIQQLNQSLYDYASQGLRTLVLGYKVINREVYQEWENRYNQAIIAIGPDRMQRIYELQSQIEKNIFIIGATAIEDKLQNQVKQTINYLKSAGIKVWMLTGDKKQTAVSIGFSCGLISQSCQKITLDCEPQHAQNLIDNVISLIDLDLLKGQKVTIVSGEILKKMKQTTKEKLAKLLKQSSSVICCRVSPKDKEDLTKIVKQWGRTLAVGDGANDVNMINAANVGVGVRGIQGSQATRAADYIIGEFKMLKKLVTFYGMNFYYRNSQVTLYNLYKNILVTFPILAYGPLSILSSTYIYDTWIFQFYNIFYTSLPIIIFGFTDIKFSQQELSKQPQIYQIGQRSTFFNTKTLAYLFLSSAFFGSIFVYVSYYITQWSIMPEGFVTYQIWSGMLVFNICVLSVNARIFMVSNQISFLLIISVILSILSYYFIFWFVGTILYSQVKNVLSSQLTSGIFWAVLICMLFLIEMFEWTVNKVFNQNNKHLVGGKVQLEQSSKLTNAFNEQIEAEYNEDKMPKNKKGKSLEEKTITSRGLRKNKSHGEHQSPRKFKDINGKDVSGGYAFAQDEQRSMNYI